MVFTDNFIPSTSSSPPHEPDDISAFLRHLLHRSSSSAPPSSPPPPPPLFLPLLPSDTTVGTHAGDYNTTTNNNNNNSHNRNNDNNKKTPFSFSSTSNFLPTSGPPAVFSGSDRLVVDRISHHSSNAVVLSSSSPTGYLPAVGGGSHLSSNNEYTEDCDYESEEGAEAAADGTEARQAPLRNQSKRTRAAEVHNLSEKRRRSRINEKMKALQNLIPNSNKTDKASMLDEAIEYLKQLQLQVQMLSMRNGLSLHPMCLPEDQEIMHATQLPQIGMHNLSNRSTSYDPISMTNPVNMIPDASHSTFNLANQCGTSGRSSASLPRVSNVINSEAAAFGLESSVHFNFRPFQTLNSPRQTVCREQNLPQERSFINKHEMKSSVTTMPLSFGAGDSNVEGYNSLGVHSQAKYGPQGTLLDSIVGQNQRTSSIFSSLHAASSSARNDKLTIGR